METTFVSLKWAPGFIGKCRRYLDLSLILVKDSKG